LNHFIPVSLGCSISAQRWRAGSGVVAQYRTAQLDKQFHRQKRFADALCQFFLAAQAVNELVTKPFRQPFICAAQRFVFDADKKMLRVERPAVRKLLVSEGVTTLMFCFSCSSEGFSRVLSVMIFIIPLFRQLSGPILPRKPIKSEIKRGTSHP